MSGSLNRTVSSIASIVALCSCGTSSSGSKASIPDQSGGSKVTPAALSTSTTLNLYPATSSFSEACDSYFLVMADNYLSNSISQASMEEKTAGSASYQAAIKLLARSPENRGRILAPTDIATLKSVAFPPETQAMPALTQLANALTNLKSAFSQLCQPIHPVDTTVNSLISVAQAQGLASQCSNTATLLQSSADPSYAVVMVDPANNSGQTCFSNGSTGILERLNGSNATPVETYVEFPCGQAAPAILLSLFGSRSLDICYPSNASGLTTTASAGQ